MCASVYKVDDSSRRVLSRAGITAGIMKRSVTEPAGFPGRSHVFNTSNRSMDSPVTFGASSDLNSTFLRLKKDVAEFMEKKLIRLKKTLDRLSSGGSHIKLEMSLEKS